MKAKDVKTWEDLIIYLDQVGAAYVITWFGGICGLEVIRVYDKRTFDKYDEYLYKTFRNTGYSVDVDKPHIDIIPTWHDDEWYIKRFDRMYNDIKKACKEKEPVFSLERLCKEIWAMSRKKRVT